MKLIFRHLSKLLILVSVIFRNVPSPGSERTVQSSTAAEREEVSNTVTREREQQEDKTDGLDTEGSSTKGDANEVRRPRNHNGTKRKKKTGVIKNVAEIEALELATEQTLKVCHLTQNIIFTGDIFHFKIQWSSSYLIYFLSDMPRY
jgi:hypothetical protein